MLDLSIHLNNKSVQHQKNSRRMLHFQTKTQRKRIVTMKRSFHSSLNIFLYCVLLHHSFCHGWSFVGPSKIQQQPSRANLPTVAPATNANSQHQPARLPSSPMKNKHIQLQRSITTSFIAAVFFFVPVYYDLHPAFAEGRTPPVIQSESTDRALQLSQKLKQNHARMYGAYWCSHCAAQKEAFGKQAFEALQYVECGKGGENSQATTLCLEKAISGYPTWEIKGRLYPGERSLDEMEVLVRMAEASPVGNSKTPPKIVTSSSDRALAVANQLKDLNTKLYGAYWCTNTFEQKELLGKQVFDKIPYIECGKDGDNSQLELCKQQKVQVVPTWQIDGDIYRGVQGLDDLEYIISERKGKSVVGGAGSSSTVFAVAEDASTEKAIKVTTAESKETEKPTPIVPPEEVAKPDLPKVPVTNISPSPATASRTIVLAERIGKLPETRLYGASWCQFTRHQRELFTKEGMDKIPYIECNDPSQRQFCRKKGVKTFPTWEIFGNIYDAREFSLDELDTLVEQAEKKMVVPLPTSMPATMVKTAFSQPETKKTPDPSPTPGPALAPTPSTPLNEVTINGITFKITPIPKVNEPATAPTGPFATADKTATFQPPNIEEAESKAPPDIKSASSKQGLVLANQLELLNAKMYGAYWCSNCANQKELLGKEAFRIIDYVECAKDGENSRTYLCKQNGISSVPTWEINGKLHVGEQSLDGLEAIVNAEMASSKEGTKEQQNSPTKTESNEATAATATASAVKPQTREEEVIEFEKKRRVEEEARVKEFKEREKEKAADAEKAKKAGELVAHEQKQEVAVRAEPMKEAISALDMLSATDKQSEIATATTVVPDNSERLQAPPTIRTTSSARANKLADKLEMLNAKLYGAYWCGFTNAQKERLVKDAFDKIRYVECSKDGLNSAVNRCIAKKIQGYPTWEINGKLFPGDQDLEELEAIVEKESQYEGL